MVDDFRISPSPVEPEALADPCCLYFEIGKPGLFTWGLMISRKALASGYGGVDNRGLTPFG